MKHELITPLETSVILGVCTGTLAVWRCTGRYKLKYKKIGKNVMYALDDIHEFIENRIDSK